MPRLENAPRPETQATPIGEAWVEGGILWHRLKVDADVTEEAALATVDVLRRMVGNTPIPAVVDARGVQFASRSARDVFARDMSYELATAIIVSSRMSKALGNAYLRLSRPDRPTRIFTSMSEAAGWANVFIESSFA